MGDISADTFASMIAHMNDDHAEAVVAYVHYYSPVRTVQSARIIAMDAHGLTVEASSGSGTSVLAIPFDHELVDGDDGRNTLIAMYMQATAATATDVR